MKYRLSFFVFLFSWAMAGAVHAASCSVSNSFGSCTSGECGAGTTPVCYSDNTALPTCKCKASAFPGELTVSGAGSVAATVRLEVLDISCAVLPCTPSIVGNTSVAVSPGLSAASFSSSAAAQLQTALSGTCTASTGTIEGEGVTISCPTFYPKYRICDAALGSCPDDPTPGTGTSGDSGVGFAGFDFKAVAPVDVVPILGPAGLVALIGGAFVLAWIALKKWQEAEGRG